MGRSERAGGSFFTDPSIDGDWIPEGTHGTIHVGPDERSGAMDSSDVVVLVVTAGDTTVTATHKPSGLTATATSRSYLGAREQAMAGLHAAWAALNGEVS